MQTIINDLILRYPLQRRSCYLFSRKFFWNMIVFWRTDTWRWHLRTRHLRTDRVLKMSGLFGILHRKPPRTKFWPILWRFWECLNFLHVLANRGGNFYCTYTKSNQLFLMLRGRLGKALEIWFFLLFDSLIFQKLWLEKGLID